MLEISLALLVIAAIGGICFWRRASPTDRSIHTVITKPHDTSAPVGLSNLPQGSRLGAHSGRPAAILTDGTILAESAGGAKTFANLAAYRDYVGDQKALSFGSQPA
jgi:hypothetical protein